MLGAKAADRVLVVVDRRGDEAVALAGLDHDVVVLREGLRGELGLVRVGGRRLAQRLAHVPAAATLHAREDVLVGPRDVDHDGRVVRLHGERWVAHVELVLDGEAHEDDLAVAGGDEVAQCDHGLALLFLRQLARPDGSVVRAEVVVSVRLVVGEGRDAQRFSPIIPYGDAAPERAARDGFLVARPLGGLLYGKLEAKAVCLGHELVKRKFLSLHAFSSRLQPKLLASSHFKMRQAAGRQMRRSFISVAPEASYGIRGLWCTDATLEVQTHGDALGGHVLLHLSDGVGAEVEHACRKHGVRLAVDDAFGKVLELPDSA